MTDLDSIPEGCTPKDAQVLRNANHEFAQQNFELKEEVERLQKKISHLERINQDFHSVVSGYLSGDAWNHWQEYHKQKLSS